MSKEFMISEYTKKDKIHIVILYSTTGHYVTGMLKALLNCGKDISIDMVHWDVKNINSSKYIVEELDGVNIFKRSKMSELDLLKLLQSVNPDILYVSGWQDKGYVRTIRRYRSSGGQTQVVCGIDDQWKGTARQRLGQLYFYFFYRKIYDFMWVSGKPQYHYAQRFGYKHENIISNLYSADTTIFKEKANINKRFIFVGRFVEVKGLDLLFSAYNLLDENVKAAWPLVLIGDGGLKEWVEKQRSQYIIVKPYMQIKELQNELSLGGVACIPSRKEQWGVPIHEMALLGLPLVLSSACGAATEFLISGYNGYLARGGDVNSLREALHKITKLSNEELKEFSYRSELLGQRINSELTAYSLLSVLELKNI